MADAMTSRERLMAAMRRQEVDRIPVHVRGVNFWDERWVATRHASYRPVVEAVRQHGDPFIGWGVGGGPLLTTSQEVRFETAVVPGDDWNEHLTTMHTPLGPLTARHRTSNRGLPGMQMEFYIQDLGDIEKVLSAPWEPPRPQAHGFQELAQRFGERGLVTCDLSDPISYVHNLMGSERLAVWSRTERRQILRLVNAFGERLLDLVEHLLSAGVGPVFRTSGQEFAVPPLMSPQDFRDFCIEPEVPIHGAIHEAGGLVHIHCHGPMDKVLEGFLDIGVDCLHPIEPPPMGDVELAEAKRRVGHRICLEGNLQIGDLYAAPTGEVTSKTLAALRDGGPTGFILCPTASPHTEVLSDLTVRNYLAMIETAARFQ